MKILFDHPSPFLLAHGGLQTQIEQTKTALEKTGTSVEFLRWWDPDQRGDIIHFFGRPSGAYIDFAHGKKIRVVMAELLTGLGSRSAQALMVQKATIGFVRNALPSAFWAKMGWDAYGKADRILALTEWEGQLMKRIFSAPSTRVTVVPNGVDEVFLKPMESVLERGKFLVCTATITERKRILELALAAIRARTPLRIVGKPYRESDPYAERFFHLAHEFPEIIRYEGPIADQSTIARMYGEARGFVLLSAMESLSLSALEAAACGCPLLLSDLPWARSHFGATANYCPIEDEETTEKALRDFYDGAPNLAPPLKPASWIDVAASLNKVYAEILSGR